MKAFCRLQKRRYGIQGTSNKHFGPHTLYIEELDWGLVSSTHGSTISLPFSTTLHLLHLVVMSSSPHLTIETNIRDAFSSCLALEWITRQISIIAF